MVSFVLLNGPSKGKPVVKAGFAMAGDDALPFAPSFTGAVTSLPALQDAAKGNGCVTSLPDSDGIIRRVPLIFRYDDKLYPSLAAEALRVAQPDSSYIIKSSGASGEASFGAHTGINHIRVGQFAVPTDANGSVILWDSGSKEDRFFPAWKVSGDWKLPPPLFTSTETLVSRSADAMSGLPSPFRSPIATATGSPLTP